MIKAIIFDCFGVLVGSGFWNVYEKLGGDLSKDKDFINEKLDEANLGHITSIQFRQAMAGRLSISITEYQAAFRKDEVPNEKLFLFMREELKPNYKLALISNATGNSVRRKIPEDKLELFDELFISAEVGLLKPDPALFRLALKKLDAEARETIFVDDHQEYVDGAKSVGMNSILFHDLDIFKLQIKSYEQ